MVITIIGLGLIGGSMSLTLQKNAPGVFEFIGVDNNAENCKIALERGIVREVLPMESAIAASGLVILAVPVDVAVQMLPNILALVKKQVVMDAGSTKAAICSVLNGNAQRGRFVASHPMWGTEYSGPSAAVNNGFATKAAVICNKEDSDEDALQLIERIYNLLGMHIVYMMAKEHDMHTAYISHISHIISFALANTVLEKEKEHDKIFELASGGFESTARLAKSNVHMWLPIFMQNKDNVLDVLEEYLLQLNKIKKSLQEEDALNLEAIISNANTIKRILK